MIEFIQKLEKAILLGLPGEEAHFRMMSYKRASADAMRSRQPAPRESAVLILLFPENNEWHIAFIQRQDYDGVHSGQISFPGGKAEIDDASLEFTALRETNEEIGANPNEIKIIGKLTEVFIPPSNFIVTPFLGYGTSIFSFDPNPIEVKEIIKIPISRLIAEDSIQIKPIYIRQLNSTIKTPCFAHEEKIIWGATAMMLMELREIIHRMV